MVLAKVTATVLGDRLISLNALRLRMKSDFSEMTRTPAAASARVAIRTGLVASGIFCLALAAAHAQAPSGGDAAASAPAAVATETPAVTAAPPAVTAAPKVEAAPAATAPALPAVQQRATSAAPATTTTARMKPVRKAANAVTGEPGTASASLLTTGSVAKTAAVAGAQAAGKSGSRCTRMAFEVNDYGKDGPTKDAMQLLDVHVAKWAAEKNIKKYTIGKKVVNCRLFLDFGVFDEHTCRAEAPVCW